jgi:chemotaxis-related protein WspB
MKNMLFLGFTIGEQRFAITASEVVEVVPMVTMEKVPGAPDCVAGMMLYHGDAVPVVDLCALGTANSAKRLMSTRIMVVRCPVADGRDHLLGLVAEHMTETVDINEGELEQTGVSIMGAEFTGRIYYDNGKMVHTVDAGTLVRAEIREKLFAAVTEERV